MPGGDPLNERRRCVMDLTRSTSLPLLLRKLLDDNVRARLVEGVLMLLLFPGLPLLGLLLLLLLIFILEGVVSTTVGADTAADEAFVLIDESESPSVALFAASDWD